MGLIDFILNLAALLLWFNWRSLRYDPLVKTSAASLAGTLRRAEPQRHRGWPLLLGLAALLGVRSWIYAVIGPAVSWTPKLDLFVVVLPFRTDVTHAAGVYSILLYSFLAFGRFLVLAYFWMYFLNVVNQRVVDPDPLLRMLRLHLGRTVRWPWFIQLLLPMLVLAVFWVGLHPVLLRTGIVSPVRADSRLIEQGLTVGAGLVFSLKYLIPAFLLIHLITSYVFLGNSPLWDFVAVTTRNFLSPFRWLPLQLGKYDFAPLFWLLLIVLLFYAPVPGWLHQKLNDHHLTLWPQ